MSFPVLTVLALLPIVAGVLVMFLRGGLAKAVGLLASLLVLVLGVVAFVASVNGTDMSEKHQWISSIGAWYALSSDPLSMTMVLLTVALVPVVLGAEWHIGERAVQAGAESTAPLPTSMFFGLALVLEGLAVYCFVSVDVLLFYLFFEATLIPMYFLISGWGGPRRRAAAIKFLIYSLAGGLVMLAAVIGLGVHSGGSGQPSFLLADLARTSFDGSIGRYLFVGFFIAFAVKAPMVPVHTWLPDAAEQASPGASTLLVGILDKIGTFGMLRLCLGLFPQAAAWATPVVLVLAVISILWGAMMAATSKDLMRLVSYTSVSHFGFMVLGIFAVTTPSITGSIFYMFNHGFSTAALFLVLGFLVHRRGSAQIKDFGGIQHSAPVLAGLFLVSGLATLGLPGTASFASEFLVMAGAWARHPVYVAIATIGMVLAAVYVLRAYKRTMTGPEAQPATEMVPEAPPITDLVGREKLVLAPLIIVLLVFGFFPRPMLHAIEPAARATMSQVGMSDPQPVVKEGLK
ncbi:NADH-quinone oxidoreductase subunit M [Acidipropionibacterium jensenii]|uniref:NADH-quinone oxidoreductase subunit M n=5 Tax=Acidipropionibacterium jensenii TaxID=1749 RepID=A0A448P1M0_9ACTN|nr:NADH-quinone oxidoreductase subunit M [Acidipropionibacterium jensenii]AZZ38853.1 NADH-quinone oxidoreductase subunit M [Acidipropionibacterium jensenii]MDN5976679.1 NADH-quinone oxidoreductase subunit M [Acidipropionibacterium jensenii]MDN5995065.1 NADH-quinone oxidoreductase subunit M [Acidipropionibacterium jensenii]MDN6427421.1 NADH-quinone oxidoreductase subunit M [Acidipropionibacterium jensenii]MDN6440834.1 NADH-quinone oxidoreductase subunit M [Acidipropionibacterium jensenii]